jgi:hypothetical protein
MCVSLNLRGTYEWVQKEAKVSAESCYGKNRRSIGLLWDGCLPCVEEREPRSLSERFESA